MRRCSVCQNAMLEGWCADGGLKYYCSEECLSTDFTPEEWLREVEENPDSYWTQWDVKDDYDEYSTFIEILKDRGIRDKEEICWHLATMYDYLADDEISIIVSDLF